MDRITLNLARRPPENLRRVRILWGGALGVLALLLVILGGIALSGWRHTRPIQRETDRLRSQIAPLLADEQQAEAPLRNAAVQQALSQAQFFNQLIERKSVSWTRLFERLEQIMPPGVELVSLRPLQRNGQDAVDLRFASDTLQPAIDFVQALETSGDFSQAQVERETAAEVAANNAGLHGQAPPPRFQLEVTALYRPSPNPVPGAAPAGSPKPGAAKVAAAGGKASAGSGPAVRP